MGIYPNGHVFRYLPARRFGKTQAMHEAQLLAAPEPANPIQALQQAYGVPLAHIAKALDMSRDQLQRQRDGRVTTPQTVRLACEALDNRWRAAGHGYVHPNKINPTRRKN